MPRPEKVPADHCIPRAVTLTPTEADCTGEMFTVRPAWLTCGRQLSGLKMRRAGQRAKILQHRQLADGETEAQKGGFMELKSHISSSSARIFRWVHWGQTLPSAPTLWGLLVFFKMHALRRGLIKTLYSQTTCFVYTGSFIFEMSSGSLHNKSP